MNRSLLRWYPPEWRERYGAEMLALIEDTLGGKPPTRRLRVELMLAGIREGLRQGGFVGRDRSAANRCRAGQVLVLIGWAAIVVAGAMFAKSTEHWRAHTAPANPAVPNAAYLTLEIAAAIGAAAITTGVLISIPVLRRALAAGRWPSMRGPIRLAGVLTAVTAAATTGLGTWGHHLTSLQRNGGSHPYTGAFLAWGFMLVATIASWTRAGIRIQRQLRPSARVLVADGLAAALTAAATLAATTAIVAWWTAIAVQSPWVLRGAPPGSHASWWTLNLGLTALVALLGSAAALAGGHRLGSAAYDGLWQRDQHD